MKKKIETMLNLIRKMEQNTFLLKDSWSEKIELLSSKYAYKTYVGHRGDRNRYIDIELYTEESKVVTIHFNKNEIRIDKGLTYKFSIDDCLKALELIFNELHSFANHDEGARKIRKQISEAKSRIRTEQQNILRLQKELEDCLSLKSETRTNI